MAARITLESALKDIITESEAMNNSSDAVYFASRNKLWRRARWVFDNAVDIRVERANNEQKGYAEADIGFPTIPMRTKAVTGDRQTADYVVFWKFRYEGMEAFRKMGICFERKEVKDFHSTIISNYDRFDRELDRALKDPKTKMMIILIEGSLTETLAYLPPKIYYGDQVKNMISMKLGAIAGITARGVHISFRGSRQSSVNSIKGYTTHFFEKNIEFVLREEIKDIKENGVSDKYRQKLPEAQKVDATAIDAVIAPSKPKPKRKYTRRRKSTSKR